ncbi:MAG: transglutaminase domain-containing protein [Dehalococcoidia bacterium]
MTLRATWDRPAPPATPTTSGGGRPRLPAFVSWEELLTFSLMLVALLSVVISVERADWVAEMPRLTVAALVGMVSGWILGRTKAPAYALHLVGIAIGFAVVLGMVMHTLRLANPLVSSGVGARWSELWERIGIWFEQLWSGDVSTDPLPFVLLVVFAAWALAYIASWAVVRWKNPWLALAPGAVALLTNISYLPGQPSLEFIVFLFAGILLFARLHLLRTVERWEGERADAPPWLSLEVLNLATWVGVGLIFVAWVIPTANHLGPVSGVWDRMVGPIEGQVDRAGRLFVGVNSKQPIEAHTFGTVLPLKSSIRLDGDPLFTVETEASLYLRGATYDQYGASGWRQTEVQQRDPVDLTVDAAALGTQQTRAQFREPLRVQVQVNDPIAEERLFAAGDALVADRGVDLLTGPQAEDVVGFKPSDRLQSGDSYVTVGTRSAATVDRLVTASPDYPAWLTDRYLQLPDDLPPEVRELAREVAGNDRVPFVVASKIERYLRETYAYSQSVGRRPPLRDAVAYFLFDTQKGYFDYHASAMAVMLRSLGIPARLAIGFAVDAGAADPQSGLVTLSERNSWAWTEVYFPGYGWVEFNPTPGLGAVVRAADDSQFLDPSTGLPFEDPTLTIDPALLPPELQPDLNPSPLEEAPAAGGTSLTSGLFAWLLLAAVVFLLLAGAGRFAWASAFRGLTPASRRWAKVQLLSGWAGLQTREEQTPNEAAATLSSVLRPSVDVRPLARSYVVERYGRPDAARAVDDGESLDELYVTTRKRLVRRIVHRFLPFV